MTMPSLTIIIFNFFNPIFCSVNYQELQEMKNKLMALLENNANIYNLVQKYPFGMIIYLLSVYWLEYLRYYKLYINL